MIDEQDKKVISLIQGNLPLDPSPFALLAHKIGIDEDEFIDRVKSLKERGYYPAVRGHLASPGGRVQFKCHGRLVSTG